MRNSFWLLTSLLFAAAALAQAAPPRASRSSTS